MEDFFLVGLERQTEKRRRRYFFWVVREKRRQLGEIFWLAWRARHQGGHSFLEQEKKPAESENESRAYGRVRKLESYWSRSIRKCEKLTKL